MVDLPHKAIYRPPPPPVGAPPSYPAHPVRSPIPVGHRLRPPLGGLAGARPLGGRPGVGLGLGCIHMGGTEPVGATILGQGRCHGPSASPSLTPAYSLAQSPAPSALHLANGHPDWLELQGTQGQGSAGRGLSRVREATTSSEPAMEQLSWGATRVQLRTRALVMTPSSPRYDAACTEGRSPLRMEIGSGEGCVWGRGVK